MIPAHEPGQRHRLVWNESRPPAFRRCGEQHRQCALARAPAQRRSHVLPAGLHACRRRPDIGGVVSRVINSPRGPVAYYDPSAPYADANGMVAAPDIDIATEFVDLITAELDFAANLMVLRVESDMMASLFDI